MLAGRTFLRCFRAFMDIAAIIAFPPLHFLFLEYFPLFQIIMQFLITGGMRLLCLGDIAE